MWLEPDFDSILPELKAHLPANARVYAEQIGVAVQQAHCQTKPLDEDVVRAGLEALLAKHPLPGATKDQAAVHEAAHLVSHKAAGMGPTRARIFGSSGFSRGWGGEARAMGPRCVEQLPEKHDPREFVRDARTLVAGPVAEELIAGGDALSSIGELVQAWVYVNRASELLDCDHTSLWRKLLAGTVTFVEHHASEIHDVAKVLERRREIHDDTPAVRRILGRVKQAPVGLKSMSNLGRALARKIDDAVNEVMS
jgi:hypothetical protein